MILGLEKTVPEIKIDIKMILGTDELVTTPPPTFLCYRVDTKTTL